MELSQIEISGKDEKVIFDHKQRFLGKKIPRQVYFNSPIKHIDLYTNKSINGRLNMDKKRPDCNEVEKIISRLCTDRQFLESFKNDFNSATRGYGELESKAVKDFLEQRMWIFEAALKEETVARCACSAVIYEIPPSLAN